MSLLWRAITFIVAGLADSLFGYFERRQARKDAIEAEQAKDHIEAQKHGEIAKKEVNDAMRKELNNPNPDLRDFS